MSDHALPAQSPTQSATQSATPSASQYPPELVLHQLPGGWGLPSLSPFCLKLETYLRIRCIPYRTVVVPSPFKGPKKKVPWIEHPGGRLGDSGFIIEFLERRHQRGPDSDAISCPDDAAVNRAQAHAAQRLIEDSLAWVLMYDRWLIDSAERRALRGIVLAGAPLPLRPFIAPLARRGVRHQLEAQGLGRHSPDEVYAIGRQDIAALAGLLGAKPYFGGARPDALDASAYGVLANILRIPIASPLKEEASSWTNLVAFVERIGSLYFS